MNTPSLWVSEHKVRILMLLKVLLSLVLITAGVTKLWSPQSSEAYVYVLDWLPITLTLAVLEILPWVEILTGLAVWMKPVERPALWVMTGLFFQFFALSYLRKRDGLDNGLFLFWRTFRYNIQ